VNAARELSTSNYSATRSNDTPWVFYPIASAQRRGRGWAGCCLAIGVLWLTWVAPIDAASSDTAAAPPVHRPAISTGAVLGANRTTTWSDNGTQMLLLERGVSITVGSYGFQADRALIRIDSPNDTDGAVRHLSMSLDNARPLAGYGPVQANAPKLTVSTTTAGPIKLNTDLLQPRQVEVDLDYHGLLAQAQPKSSVGPGLDDAPAGTTKATVLPSDGVVGLSADKIVYQPDTNGHLTVSLIGQVRVIYTDTPGHQAMTLTADNAVIFLANDVSYNLGQSSVKPTDVLGVYLEDNVVATDGQYTVRAPRVFYDLQRNKAVLLDAVFYTWDPKNHIPIYLRAKTLRQESLNSWSADHAKLTTSEFAVPHFSIGANQITFKRQPQADGSSTHRFTAKHTTLQWGQLPLFYWPYLSGQAHDLPLRSITVGHNGQNGPQIKTTWDLFSLTGRTKPNGVDLFGRLDYLGDHGAAVGVNLEYDLPRMYGQLEGYLIAHDTHEDDIGGRGTVDINGDTRGYILWQHRQYLRDDWELSLELAHVSDRTFLEEFFLDQAELSKPYETSLYLKKQKDDWAFAFLAQYELFNFTAQTTTLQAPGYTVEKLPQLSYWRVGTSLWGDRLTYFSQTHLDQMRIRAGSGNPSDRGFTNTQSRLLFGVPSTTDFDEVPALDGVPKGHVLRLDTRHELQAPLKMGALDLVPYVAGRVTFYDDNFSEFSDGDDNLRLWGSLGLRIHSQANKVYNHIQSRALDLNRLRHIFEPSLDIFWTGATINSEDLPVYDADVEGLNEGFGIRLGVRNTLQTQRGGLGRWRSVDWLVINTDLVLRSDDSDQDTEIARFFSYRPEFSPGGDHFQADWQWMVSDTLAAVGQLTYNLEDHFVAQWRFGASFQHTPRFASFLDFTEIEPLSSRLLHYGIDYTLTPKYHLELSQTLDFQDDDSRNLEVAVERRLPGWRLVFRARYDDVDDDQSFSVVLIPVGIGSSKLIAPAQAWANR